MPPFGLFTGAAITTIVHARAQGPAQRDGPFARRCGRVRRGGLHGGDEHLRPSSCSPTCNQGAAAIIAGRDRNGTSVLRLIARRGSIVSRVAVAQQ